MAFIINLLRRPVQPSPSTNTDKPGPFKKSDKLRSHEYRPNDPEHLELKVLHVSRAFLHTVLANKSLEECKRMGS